MNKKNHRKKKRTLSAVLAFCMAFTCLPLQTIQASENNVPEDYYGYLDVPWEETVPAMQDDLSFSKAVGGMIDGREHEEENQTGEDTPIFTEESGESEEVFRIDGRSRTNELLFAGDSDQSEIAPEELSPSPVPDGELPSPATGEEPPSPTPEGELPSPTPEGELPSPTPGEEPPSPTPEEQPPSPTPEEQPPTPTPEEQPPTPTPDPEAPGSRFPNLPTEEAILSYLNERYPATRDQTTNGVHYGTCWAHAAVSLAEFYLLRHGLEDQRGPVDTHVNYSELQLAYFCYNQGPEPISGDTGDRVSLEMDLVEGRHRSFLNFGGNLAFAAQSLMRGNGFAADEGELAYANAANVLANGLSGEYAHSRNVISLKNQFLLNLRQNPQLVKDAIRANGAVGVTYYSAPKYLNTRTNAYYNNYNTTFNHAVVLVGWDDEYPAENFKTLPPGNGAWLVRNSHSADTRFNEESYFWLSYYDTSLGEASYVYEMGRTHDNHYCYDAQLHMVKKAASTKSANVFTAVRNSESLEAVQFDVTNGAPGRYTVSVYKDLTDISNPESGLLSSRITGSIPFTGKFTLDLDAPVSLTQGETFSVVVDAESPVDRESDTITPWKNQLVADVSMHAGESFACMDGEWVDLSEKSYNGARGNLCIRALSDNKMEPLPDGITSLTLHENSEEAVILSWPAANAAEGYEIRRSVSENDAFVTVGTTTCMSENEPSAADLANLRFTDSSAPLSTSLYYQIVPIRQGSADLTGASPKVLVIRPDPSPKEVVLFETAPVLEPGETLQITSQVLPEGADKQLSWKSGSPEIVAVSETGLITARKEGTATIRAETANGVRAYAKVTVRLPEVSEVRISKKTLTVYIGLTKQLTAKVLPENAKSRNISWKSSNTKIASVSKQGVVTAVSAGACTITATSSNGVKASCKLTVKPKTVYECEKNGVYRYTLNTASLKKSGWTVRKAFNSVGVSNKPVYWTYNKKCYHYTTSKSAALAVKKAGGKAGIAFYASESKKTPVYELYLEGKRPSYYYTTSRKTVREMKKKGWLYKGIGWYAG